MNTKKVYYIISAFWSVLLWLCVILFTLGEVTFDCNSFAVDSDGRLYVGIRDIVSVYQDGERIRQMPAITNRAYAFTILEDDTILWSTGSTIYITDLYGTKISKSEDEYARTYNSLKHNKTYETADQSIYYKHNSFGRFVIYKDDSLVYEHPKYNQTVLLIGIFSVVSLVICTLGIIYKKTEDGSPS